MMDYTNLYRTRIQKTFDEDQTEIFSRLSASLETKAGLEFQLINYYKGMLVSYKAVVVELDKGTVELTVNPQQAVAIAAEHYTFIRCALFKHDIVARAQYVDIKRKAVSLRQLCYVDILAERRNHIRLKLQPAINACLVVAQGEITGALVELSTAGTIMVADNPRRLDMEDVAKLHFILPDADQSTTCSLRVSARLITILDDSRPWRYIFSITADRNSERHIAKYLFNRQLEIVRELKDYSTIG